MAQTKNALIRYKTIDKCLQNHYRTWTLDDLIEACSDALYEYEGKDVYVSRRTIQLDIQTMRSDKLGYNAPIVVYEKKYYKYDETDFSITNIPLTESDMQVLSESVEMLKQFKDFSLFSELGDIIHRLEDKIYTEKADRNPVIHLDKNENLKGLYFLDTLYQAIVKEIPLRITYQSFKASRSSVIPFHPYLLKEYNNRWFVVGKKSSKEPVLSFALDRIKAIDLDLKSAFIRMKFNGDDYYKNTIGVSVLNPELLTKTILKIDKINAPYVITKPFHQSQKLLESNADGSILIELVVDHNYEFERLILGFGDGIEVLRPASLRKKIFRMIRKAYNMYSESSQIS